MNSTEYQLLAQRTLKEFEDIQTGIGMCAVGVADEYMEVCLEVQNLDISTKLTVDQASKFLDEVGDVIWYMSGWCTLHGKAFISEEIKSLVPHDKNIMWYIQKILSTHKKSAYHGKPYNTEEIYGYIQKLLGIFEYICSINGLNIQEVFELNIKKLCVRVPKNFTDEKFLDRDLEKESQVFKKE